MKFPKAILNCNKQFLTLIAVVLAILIGIAEFSLHESIDFSLLYLIPISLIVLLVGRIEGFALAVVSSLGFILIDYLLNGWSVIYFTIINAAMRFGIFACFVILLYFLKEAHEREAILARRDSLTGVLNGRGFYEDIKYEVAKFNRENGVITLAYMDIDNFKTVNDTLGHNEGDMLLRLVASTIEKTVRSVDSVARLGGDEFAVLFPGMNENNTKKIISRIKEILDEQAIQNKLPISFSMGVVTFNKLPSSIDEMIKIADEHMYAVKNNGKNNVDYYIYPS